MSLTTILNPLKNINELLVVCAFLNVKPKILDESLIIEAINQRYDDQKIDRHPRLKKYLLHLRDYLDRFYAKGGYLLTKRAKIFTGLWQDTSAPPVFFGRNELSEQLEGPMIAIVGSRDASLRALTLTRELAKKLTRHGFTVVSGGALGIDIAAHEGALSEGITVAVLGQPVNFLEDERPERLRFLSKDMLTTLTPFAPTVFMGRHLFLERNRFVAAMSQAVIIVQGKRGSGTLSTSNFALKFKKPVFAVPGNIEDPLAFVPNSLIYEKKATALVDIDAFIAFFTGCSQVPKNQSPSPLKSDEEKLIEILRNLNRPLSVDELIVYTGWELLKLQALILDLELKHCIKKLGAVISLGNRGLA